MDRPRTICTECYHLVRKGSNEQWYTFFCGANRRPEKIDPVSGAKGYSANGSFTDEPLPHCQSFNSGECPHYKEL